MRRILLGCFGFYRWVLSPILHSFGGPGTGCRFEPSCSHYAQEALEKHGWLRGCSLTLKRVLKCQPWSRTAGGNWDPVP